MTARASRLIAFALLLAFVLGGIGHSGRGVTAMMQGAGPGRSEASLGIGGLHDLCVTPRADGLALSPALSLALSVAHGGTDTPSDSDNQPTQGHEHCADCLVRAVAAPPPHLPQIHGRSLVAILARAWSLSPSEPKTPSTAAHGARAPPRLIV